MDELMMKSKASDEVELFVYKSGCMTVQEVGSDVGITITFEEVKEVVRVYFQAAMQIYSRDLE